MENCKIKHRDVNEKRQMNNRLNRIEGQLKGIRQMIEKDVYCDDILIQISAVEHSIKSLGRFVLKNHLKTCIKEELLRGNDAIIEEVIALFGRLES
jgi:DNA-binding FrmR family transcriptional regulator